MSKALAVRNALLIAISMLPSDARQIDLYEGLEVLLRIQTRYFIDELWPISSAFASLAANDAMRFFQAYDEPRAPEAYEEPKRSRADRVVGGEFLQRRKNYRANVGTRSSLIERRKARP